MDFNPKIGSIIRYDFLWKEEDNKGLEDGLKDRPCAVVLMGKPDVNETRRIIVCPVTHTPPVRDETGVEIPHAVARHLGLDDDRMWVKTHEVNQFDFKDGQVPFGVTKTPRGSWEYGILPYKMREQILQQVRERSQSRNLNFVKRDKGEQER